MPPEPLLRPFALDLYNVLWPVLIGIGAYFLGRCFHRWSVAVKAGCVGGTVGIILIVAALLFHMMPRLIDIAFSYVGGVMVVLCWMLLAIVGLRSTGKGAFFLRYLLIAACLALIAVESGGCLWFRLEAVQTWQNVPKETGLLSQSTNMTCLPASAAMMLQHYGYDAISEGELAYLAGTSLFGTDGHTMARAITQKIDRPDVRVEMVKPSFQDLVDRGKPFIAVVQREQIASHSIYIKKISPNTLLVLDPDINFPSHLSPDAFKSIWTGSALLIEGINPVEGEDLR